VTLLAHTANDSNIWAVWPQPRHVPGDAHIVEHHRCWIIPQTYPEDICQIVTGVLMCFTMHNEILLFGIEDIFESQRYLFKRLFTTGQHAPDIAPTIVVRIGWRCCR